MRIQEYCDALNIEIDATYYPNQSGRWCVKLARAEIKEKADSCIAAYKHGNGKTVEAALTDYVNQIRGKILLLNGLNSNRREYVIPADLLP